MNTLLESNQKPFQNNPSSPSCLLQQEDEETPKGPDLNPSFWESLFGSQTGEAPAPTDRKPPSAPLPETHEPATPPAAPPAPEGNQSELDQLMDRLGEGEVEYDYPNASGRERRMGR